MHRLFLSWYPNLAAIVYKLYALTDVKLKLVFVFCFAEWSTCAFSQYSLKSTSSYTTWRRWSFLAMMTVRCCHSSRRHTRESIQRFYVTLCAWTTFVFCMTLCEWTTLVSDTLRANINCIWLFSCTQEFVWHLISIELCCVWRCVCATRSSMGRFVG